MRSELLGRRIQLKLLIGKATQEEEKKRDAGEIPWATQIPTYYFFNGKICWQPIHRYLNGADLVVVTQENGLLANHLLILRPRNFKLAFWGIGVNVFSAKPNGFKERFKRWTTKQVDWWFAYTQITANVITSAGFPANCITVLNNAIDTSELCKQMESITVEETLALRHSLGVGDGPVGIFVGSLHVEKRLDFLLNAAEAIRREIPNFHFLVVGDGQERDKVQKWCNAHSWAHWVGAQFGREKASYFSVAQVMLNPGNLGLGILDALVCRVPVLTTDCGKHGPEIAYLENGHNGVMTRNALGDYVAATVHLLRDHKTLSTMRTSCAKNAAEYTLDNMVRRFTDGIEISLSKT
ncbi:MAG: glycosyltransferase [Candidatus Pacebacteria bacterium]|nr:glycosyltransferase [Candidatus Paceibacterota bacterium]